MDSDYNYSIEFWGEIFKEFHQVERVKSVFDADRLDIKIKGREETLQATEEELNDSLYKFRSNPHEVVASFLKENGILVYYQDTLVGYFDIHAYSHYIQKTGMVEAIRSVSRFFAHTSSVARTDFRAVKFDHWILSDSIILVVDTNRHPLFAGSLDYFLATCSSFMRTAIVQGFPLRGAIGGGDFYKDGEIMVSTGLVDAALYEKEQNWLGAVLTPNAIKLVEKAKEYEIKNKGITDIDLLSDRFKPSVRYGAIPWKPNDHLVEKPERTYYIKPFDMAEKDWAKKYIPAYFDDKSNKIGHSHCLYAEP